MAMDGLGDLTAADDPDAQTDAHDGDHHQTEREIFHAGEVSPFLQAKFLAFLGIEPDAAGAFAEPGERAGEQIIIGIARLGRPAEAIALSAWPAEIGVGDEPGVAKYEQPRRRILRHWA